MKKEQIIILVVAFMLGMLLLNVVKNVCGCELKEGFSDIVCPGPEYDCDARPANVGTCNYFISNEGIETGYFQGDGPGCEAVLRGNFCNTDVISSCPNIADNWAEAMSNDGNEYCGSGDDKYTWDTFSEKASANCAVNCSGSWGEWSACPPPPSCDTSAQQTRRYTVSTPVSGGGTPCPFSDGEQQTQNCPVTGVRDECGVCGGDGIPEGKCDCDGTGPEDNYDCDGNCLNDSDGDGICDENEIPGCTDATACNYDSGATDDDGSCASLDECGVCGGDGIPLGACDCDGTGPEDNYDCDGNCLVDTDCAGVCGGNQGLDACGRCPSERSRDGSNPCGINNNNCIIDPNNDKGYTCECSTGFNFNGTTCVQDWCLSNDGSPVDCGDGGRCQSGRNGYSCVCNDDYYNENPTDPCVETQDCIGSYNWSSCSEPCGGGTQTGTYSISTHPTGGGAACRYPQGFTESRSCNTQPCPINCEGSWSGWSGCTRQCGMATGTQTRTYRVTRPAQYGGTNQTCEARNGSVESQQCTGGGCLHPSSSEGTGGTYGVDCYTNNTCPPPTPQSPRPSIVISHADSDIVESDGTIIRGPLAGRNFDPSWRPNRGVDSEVKCWNYIYGRTTGSPDQNRCNDYCNRPGVSGVRLGDTDKPDRVCCQLGAGFIPPPQQGQNDNAICNNR